MTAAVPGNFCVNLTSERRHRLVFVGGVQEVPVAGNSTEVGRSVTSKITSILMTFTEGSEHSLTEIAQLAGLPVSTAHRLTSELASWRLLERTENGRYRAGLPLRVMGGGAMHPPDLRERAPCVIEDLATATRCRVRLGLLEELE